MDLYRDLMQKVNELEASIRALRITGTAYAQAEKDYKILLRTECLKLRDSGLAVGLIDKTCYGIPSVAEARFKRDCAKVVYQANMDSINATKLMIRILENQINREWGADMPD